MISIKKYALTLLLTASALFISCGGETGGNPSPIADDGLSYNYFLKSLSFSEGELRYPFIPGDWINYLEVPYSTESVTVTAEAGHQWQRISIGNEILQDNRPSDPFFLDVGENILHISIIAENGSELLYTIYITRCTENYFTARLSQLRIDGASLTPLFNPSSDVRNFTAITSNEMISLIAESFASDEGACNEVFINNTAVTDNNSIELAHGINNLTINAIAPNGKEKETYEIVIIRQSDTGSEKLAYLSIAGGGFTVSFDNSDPVAFNPDVLEYWINISSTMNPVNLTAVSESADITPEIQLNSSPVQDNSLIALPPGAESLITVSTGGLLYTIHAMSLQGSDNASLENITVMMGEKSFRPVYPGTAETHNPAVTGFSGNTTEYTTVVYGFSSIEITAKAEDTTVKGMNFMAFTDENPEGENLSSSLLDGEGKAEVNLTPGKTSRIEITVTAGDDTTTKKYTLYARLLNADEFYWGIYAPSFDLSKNRWKKPSSAGQSYTTEGLINGSSTWSTGPISNLYSRISVNSYNDGYMDLVYNDGGFLVSGTQYTKLDGAFSKNGVNVTENPPFEIKTKEGETVATLNYHLQVRGGDPRELEDSYTDITYMPGTDMESTRREDYRESSKPYPFSNEDWFNAEFTVPSLWD